MIARSKKIMPDYQYRSWNDVDNLKLLEKHFPRQVENYISLPNGAARVDVARCLYMYEFGGIYVDTDYKFYRSVDHLLKYRCVLGIEEQHCKWLGHLKVGNAFLASEPGLMLWMDFVETIFARQRAGEKNVVLLGGPHALSQFLQRNPGYEKEITLFPSQAIYPEFRAFKLTTAKDETTIGGHLCWGSWRNKPALQRIKSRVRRITSALL